MFLHKQSQVGKLGDLKANEHSHFTNLAQEFKFLPFPIHGSSRIKDIQHQKPQNFPYGRIAHFHSSGYINRDNFCYWGEQISTSATMNLCKVKKCVCGRPHCGYFKMICTYLFEYHTDTVLTASNCNTNTLCNFPLPGSRRPDLVLQILQFLQGEVVAHYARNSKCSVGDTASNAVSYNGHIQQPPRSPDLSTCAYLLW